MHEKISENKALIWKYKKYLELGKIIGTYEKISGSKVLIWTYKKYLELGKIIGTYECSKYEILMLIILLVA